MKALYILNNISCLLLVLHLAVDHKVDSLAGFLAEAAASLELQGLRTNHHYDAQE
jgi:hypothetical protein